MSIISRVYNYILSLFGNWEVINARAEMLNEITLDAVRDFCEEFTGVLIVGFISYGDDIRNLDSQVSTKMIVGADVRGRHLYLTLNTLTGRHGGYLKISPEVNGVFTEREVDDDPSQSSRYRLEFYGGDCFEYIDPDSVGTISYHDGFVR